jgi:hypothetical protein
VLPSITSSVAVLCSCDALLLLLLLGALQVKL